MMRMLYVVFYNHYVVHTAVTFETDPVSEAEMGQRILEVQNENLPFYRIA